MQLQFNLTQDSTQQIEPGYCQCGCGQPAPIAKSSDTKAGAIKGQPQRFIRGHQISPYPTLADAFGSRIAKGAPDECWEWQGGQNVRGYGRFMYKRKLYMVHRLAYELHYGPIAEGLSVCHHCDNPPCCNPAHLFLGTYADNNHDRHAKGRSNTVTGSRHPLSKLSESDVAAIRQRYKTGSITQLQLAKEFGVARTHISKIVLGQTRRHG